MTVEENIQVEEIDTVEEVNTLSKQLFEEDTLPEEEQVKVSYLAELKPKQRKFLEYYIEERVAWKAYVKTVAPKIVERRSAETSAYEMMQKPIMKLALKELYDNIWESKQELQGRIIDELTAIGFSTVSDYINDDGEVRGDLSEVDLRAVKSITTNTTTVGDITKTFTKLELHPKLQALTEITDILQIKKIKVEHSGQVALIDRQDKGL